MRERFNAETVVLTFLMVVLAVGCTWGLPGSDTWAADSISPRSCGLGALVLTYMPGHFHNYPPLQMGILTLLSLPWMARAAWCVGTRPDALEAELIKPLSMTAIEVSSRLLAATMATFAVLWTMRLWARLFGRRAGMFAGAVVALNATYVYYGHTGNLEIPYLFWLSATLVETDRVMCGERRETRALLLATAAVLTKDQVAAALILTLPLALIVVPWRFRGDSPWRPSLVKGILTSGALYAVASGAATNPIGFRNRVEFLLGPASQSWAQVPRGASGAATLAKNALIATPHLASWGLLVAACLGLALALARTGLARSRALIPLTAACSFAVFFTLAARRSEDRFLLPIAFLFFPYASVAFEWLGRRATLQGTWPRATIGILATACAAPALLAVISTDSTLLADPRYEAERTLAALPVGTNVEVYGGPIFLPRIPPALHAIRAGIEPINERQAIPGVVDLVDPAMDPRPRKPDVIVLATEFSDDAVLAQPSAPATLSSLAGAYGSMPRIDPRMRAFFRGLADGSLGYARSVRATCSLPFPLACRKIHDSTAGEVWIYRRTR